jgi:hypothetical protein
MAFSAPSLPQETILNVFELGEEEFEQGDLAALARLSWDWYTIAKTNLYRKLRINYPFGGPDSRDRLLAIQLATRLDQARLVKELTIHTKERFFAKRMNMADEGILFSAIGNVNSVNKLHVSWKSILCHMRPTLPHEGIWEVMHNPARLELVPIPGEN